MASSFFKPLEEGELKERDVKVRRFDSINGIKIEKPCFLKIDAEKAELQVLEGFGNKLNEMDIVQVEQTHIIKNKGVGYMGKIVLLLERFGFSGFIQVNTTYYQSGEPMKSDLIFFRGKEIKENGGCGGKKKTKGTP